MADARPECVACGSPVVDAVPFAGAARRFTDFDRAYWRHVAACTRADAWLRLVAGALAHAPAELVAQLDAFDGHALEFTLRHANLALNLAAARSAARELPAGVVDLTARRQTHG